MVVRIFWRLFLVSTLAVQWDLPLAKTEKIGFLTNPKLADFRCAQIYSILLRLLRMLRFSVGCSVEQKLFM